MLCTHLTTPSDQVIVLFSALINTWPLIAKPVSKTLFSVNNPVLCAKIHRIHNTKDPFCSPQQYFLPLGSTRVSRIEHKKRRKVRSLPPVCHHFATILPPFVQHLPQRDINVPEYHISKYLPVLLINRSSYSALSVFICLLASGCISLHLKLHWRCFVSHEADLHLLCTFELRGFAENLMPRTQGKPSVVGYLRACHTLYDGSHTLCAISYLFITCTSRTLQSVT